MTPGQDPPAALEPMLAAAGPVPRSDAGWSYEIKWDGVRALAFCVGGQLTLRSRTGRDITAVFPELSGLAEAVAPRSAILDGEIVALVDGRPSFEALLPRVNLSDPRRVARLQASVPVSYFVFDVPWWDGLDLTPAPLEARREVLGALALDGPFWGGSLVSAASAPLLEVVRAEGLEGIVCKRLGSPYRPGRRSPDWTKVKLVRRTSLVIGGWVEGDGGRRGRIGALVLGFWENGVLVYAGKAGTGFTDAELDRLAGVLEPLACAESAFGGRQPERGTRFVRPELVCEVEYLEWTAGRTLRGPSYKGLRPDVPADSVGFEGSA